MSKLFLQRFNGLNVDVLLIGGRAMKMLGMSRDTEDYDYWVNINKSNYESVYETVIEMLGYAPNFRSEQLLKPKKKLPLPGNVEVITSVDNLAFQDIFSRSIHGKLEGEEVKYPCPCDMLKLKKISAKDSSRKIDADDIAFLEKLCKQ